MGGRPRDFAPDPGLPSIRRDHGSTPHQRARQALVAAGHGAREAALCRELTKLHEEVRRGTVTTLAERHAASEPLRGELALVIGPPAPDAPQEAEIAAELRAALKDMPLKQAAAHVAGKLGVGKRDVYQLGLRLKQDD